MSVFIEDGQVLPGFIKAVEGMWPDIRFEYRPVHRDESRAESKKAKDREQVEDATLRLVASHLVSWSLPSPISFATVASIRSPQLRERIADIVFGTAPSDPDPQARPEQNEAELELAATAKANGTTVGQERALADQKN